MTVQRTPVRALARARRYGAQKRGQALRAEADAMVTRTASRAAPLALGLLTVLLGASALGAPARRAVVVGSNGAAPGQPSLRYAHEDARRMAEVLVQVGEFRPEHVQVLTDPTPEVLLKAMDQQLAALRNEPGDTLLLFYYSGHADQRFLYPGGRRLELEAVRQRVDTPVATVRLGIIDACRGGGWTQAKGLRPDPEPFEVQVPMVLRSEGSVLIASSSGLENAHEAETLRGSFFTHHLVAALRGAADQSGDGEVSVVEAFNYAREHTVRDTVLLGIAPQHPSFDLKLRGRADLPLTHVASAGSLLKLKQVRGPLRVMQSSSGGQVLELEQGERQAVLALPPGRYLVVRKSEDASLHAREVTLREGETVTLEEASLEPVDSSILARKGSAPPRRTLSLSLFPSGEFMGEAFGVEFEHALGKRFSVAVAPYLDNAGTFGGMLSGRLFAVGHAPSGFWLGATGFAEYGASTWRGTASSYALGVGPTAGFTFVYGPWMASIGATPFFQWMHVPKEVLELSSHSTLSPGWNYDRINTKVRANIGVAF
ncbi:caspase family protein [Pyxidicoccus fallax]|uniref:Caspase family protein n=1 Tax=Pyxidicoccus fallax TaxID=394095 RepID=A0A848LCW3_9BACT|nr:caspase family protein [Pyxidicoccus fallax]NMO16920.1 caspase family protein [Pyxidicoccus fallax]NPC84166.1 caspase family protein [Pyxidicoccus fallax]